MRVNAKLANELAIAASTGSFRKWQVLRDWLDGKTNGELDPIGLDRLTDMVWQRLTAKRIRSVTGQFLGKAP